MSPAFVAAPTGNRWPRSVLPRAVVDRTVLDAAQARLEVRLDGTVAAYLDSGLANA